MKLIIDIPDYEYKNIKEYYEKNDNVEATYSYIYHGTPLSEELEKVKEELIYATDVDYDEKTMRFFIGAEDIDRIFGKYIDELKGE